MSMHKVFLAALGVLLMASSAQATVITGNINKTFATDWPVNGNIAFGNGTNGVIFGWNSSGGHEAQFVGSSDLESSDSNVAFATGVTNIFQIADASIFSFNAGYIGPYFDATLDPDGVGDFIVARNISTGHYGVLRINDIQFDDAGVDNFDVISLNGTWWFQTDGTGDFSSISSVPEPSAYMLFGVGLLVLLGYRVRHKAIK